MQTYFDSHKDARRTSVAFVGESFFDSPIVRKEKLLRNLPIALLVQKLYFGSITVAPI